MAKNAQRNLKKTPPIRAPKVLQDAWDKHKTVRQNYLALGLVHNLNPSSSGGVEPSSTSQRDEAISDTRTPEQAETSIPKPALPPGYGRIIRDEAGNVIRIELAEEDEEQAESRDEEMGLLEPELDVPVLEQWVTGLGGQTASSEKDGKSTVVQALEGLSSVPANPDARTLSIPLSDTGPRHTSGGERRYLEDLVKKYGDDVERMARDRKLNPEQHTAGSLRRALRRAGLV